MSRTELARFCSEYLPKHPELKEQIDARGDQQKLAEGLATAGAAAGFAFSKADLLEAMSAEPSGALSESELESVAGGTRKAGEKPVEYIQWKLTDVLVSGYQSGGSDVGTTQ